MFARFRKGEENATPDVKNIRDRLVRFFKDRLQQWEGGEGGNIRSMHLYLTCGTEERGLYESALFIEEGNRFKDEYLQRMADDFVLDLPVSWSLEIVFTPDVPAGAVQAKDLPAALLINTRQKRPAPNRK